MTPTEKRPVYPIHPGTVLADELAELGMSPAELARELHVPSNRLYQLLTARNPFPACGSGRRVIRDMATPVRDPITSRTVVDGLAGVNENSRPTLAGQSSPPSPAPAARQPTPPSCNTFGKSDTRPTPVVGAIARSWFGMPR